MLSFSPAFFERFKTVFTFVGRYMRLSREWSVASVYRFSRYKEAFRGVKTKKAQKIKNK